MTTETDKDPFAEIDHFGAMQQDGARDPFADGPGSDPFADPAGSDPFVDAAGSDPFAQSGSDPFAEQDNPFADPAFDADPFSDGERQQTAAAGYATGSADAFDVQVERREDPVMSHRVEQQTTPEDDDPFGGIPDADPRVAAGVGAAAASPFAGAPEPSVVSSGPKQKVRSKGPSRKLIAAVAATVLVVGGGVAATMFPVPGLESDQLASIPSIPSLDSGLEGLRPAQGDAWKAGEASPSLPPMNSTAPVLPTLPASLPSDPPKSTEIDLGPMDDVSVDMSSLDLPVAGGAVSPVRDPVSVGSESPVAGATIPASEIERMRSEFASMTREIQDLRTRLASLEERPISPGPVVQPPAKPEVVENWVLKGVFGDTAWVSETRDGKAGDTRELVVGDDLDGVGKVKDITKYEGDWIVVTDAGVIVRQ